MPGVPFLAVLALALATLLAEGEKGAAPTPSPDADAPRMILGRDNAAFARALYRAGYPDLVAGACATIESAESIDAAEKAAVRSLHLDLRLEEARDLKDAIARKEALRAILDDKEAFIRDNPTTQEAEEALDNLPDVYRLLGEAITRALETEKDPEKSQTLRREAEETFERAEAALEKRLDGLTEWRDDQDQFRKRMSAAFNLGRTFYFHALVHPADSYEREKYAQLAIEKIQDFVLDFEDQLLAYQALVYEGLAHASMGKDEDALASFNEAIALRDTYGNTNGGKVLDGMPPEAADIVSSAVLQKVTILAKTKKHAEIVAECRKFFETTPDAIEALQALPLLEKQAAAELASGDKSSAVATYQRLAGLDARGPSGAAARDALGKLASGGGGGASDLDGEQLMKLAESLASRNDYDKAIELAYRCIQVAPDPPEGTDLVTSAWILIGAIHGLNGRLEDAAVAYDVAFEKGAGSPKAGDALWRSISTYVKLGGDKKAYFKSRVDERMKLLSTKYADHPSAAFAQLIEGQALEEDQDFAGAAALYAKVKPGSASYEDARFRIGNCQYRLARKLLSEKKTDEAKKAAEAADAALADAEKTIDEAAAATLDQERQARLTDLGFAARATRAEIRLMEGLGREAEVAALLDDIEKRFGNDAVKTEAIWNLRVRALKAMGKLEQAVALLDAIAAKSKDNPAVGAAAGVLARAFDEKAEKAAEKDPKDPAAIASWREAARLYSLGTRAQAASGRPAKTSDLEAVAQRLLVIGMHLNGVPEKVDSFVLWTPEKTVDKDAWQRAAEIFTSLSEQGGDYKSAVALGRTLGFLGKYVDSAATLARTIEREHLVNLSTRTLDRAVVVAKPQLFPAILDWAVAEYRAALEDKDPERFDRANSLFELLISNSEREGELWWKAKYFQIKSLYDRGQYEPADIAISSMERTTAEFGGGEKFGLKPLFVALKNDIGKKTFKRGSNPPAPPADATGKPK